MKKQNAKYEPTDHFQDISFSIGFASNNMRKKSLFLQNSFFIYLCLNKFNITKWIFHIMALIHIRKWIFHIIGLIHITNWIFHIIGLILQSG